MCRVLIVWRDHPCHLVPDVHVQCHDDAVLTHKQRSICRRRRRRVRKGAIRLLFLCVLFYENIIKTLHQGIKDERNLPMIETGLFYRLLLLIIKSPLISLLLIYDLMWFQDVLSSTIFLQNTRKSLFPILSRSTR